MSERRWTVTADTYGLDSDGPDVIVVRVDGEEVGAYCIADDPEAECAEMERMLERVGASEVEPLHLALRNVRSLAKRMRRKNRSTSEVEAANHLLRFCEDAGVVDSILRTKVIR